MEAEPKLNLRKPPQTKKMLTLLLLIALLGASAYKTDASLTALFSGIPEMGKLIVEMVPPDWSYFEVILEPMLETVQMAIVGTTIGALLAIPTALFAAHNVT